jgi:hypothetical protein
MSVSDIANIALSILGALGIGGGIVFGLSSFLGKVWADRLMAKESHTHNKELENLRSELENKNQHYIEGLKSDLNIYQEKHLRGFNDKIQTYRLMTDIIAEMLGDYDKVVLTNQRVPLDRLDATNRARIRVYGYLGMMAPQSVMDAQDQLFDYLILVAGGKHRYDWARARGLALTLLNEIRKDIGIDVTPIAYNGAL